MWEVKRHKGSSYALCLAPFSQFYLQQGYSTHCRRGDPLPPPLCAGPSQKDEGRCPGCSCPKFGWKIPQQCTGARETLLLVRGSQVMNRCHQGRSGALLADGDSYLTPDPSRRSGAHLPWPPAPVSGGATGFFRITPGVPYILVGCVGGTSLLNQRVVPPPLLRC